MIDRTQSTPALRTDGTPDWFEMTRQSAPERLFHPSPAYRAALAAIESRQTVSFVAPVAQAA